MRFSRLRDLRPAIVAVALVFLTVPAVSQPNAMALSPPSVPAGFHVSVLASGLSVPTALTIGPDSRVYAAEQCCKVLVLAKTGPQTIASGFGTILGLAWHSNRLYVSSTGEIADAHALQRVHPLDHEGHHQWAPKWQPPERWNSVHWLVDVRWNWIHLQCLL